MTADHSNMQRRRTEMADGRYLIYYRFGDEPGAADGQQSPRQGEGARRRDGAPAPQMRWNPVLRQWIVVAAHRQGRTFLPAAENCPLCPTRDQRHPTEIPEADFDLVAFENRFPSFVDAAGSSVTADDGLYDSRPAQGRCEVVVYTPEHSSSLAQQDVSQVRKVVEVWADRYRDLGAVEDVRYVFVFENRGEEMGVTLHHPHCQIYGFPFIPPVVKRELASSRVHRERTGECLFCHILEREIAGATRIVFQNRAFVAFVPFYARWPYEVHVYPRRHTTSLEEMDAGEREELAGAIKAVAMKYDGLFGFPLPYVMVMHQRPTDGGDHDHYHFHVEFYPPNRTRDRLKYLAGVELGAGVFLNDTQPEEKAKELRELMPDGE